MIVYELLLVSLFLLISSIFMKWLFTYFKWHEVIKKFEKDFIGGFRNATPFMYFISIIVFCGGIGVFISFLQGSYDISNISTYIIALMSSLMVDLVLNKDEDKYKDKDFMMCVICIFIFTMALAIVAIVINKELFSLRWYLVVTSLLSAWYLWWVLSSNDIKLGPTRNDIRDSTIGSDPSDNLQGRGLAELWEDNNASS